MKYLDILRKDFNLVKKITPLTENPSKSRNGVYEINDNFLSFWFLVVDRQRGLIEQNRFEEVEKNFHNLFNTYTGKKFEKLIIKLIREKIILKEIKFDNVGRQWGKFKGEKGKNTYEIDILCLNEETKEILFCECKWKSNIDSVPILKELISKSSYVEWNNKERKETFVIFGKSFTKKITSYEGKKVICFDLKDLESIFLIKDC